MTIKNVKCKGEFDYDYKHDILFFKSAERDYVKSLELDNVVLDLDREGFIVGIQIFEASEFLRMSKSVLLKIPQWSFEAKFIDGKIEVRLMFQIVIRNKVIKNNPIIIQQTSEKLPNSRLVCEVR